MPESVVLLAACVVAGGGRQRCLGGFEAQGDDVLRLAHGALAEVDTRHAGCVFHQLERHDPFKGVLFQRVGRGRVTEADALGVGARRAAGGVEAEVFLVEGDDLAAALLHGDRREQGSADKLGVLVALGGGGQDRVDDAGLGGGHLGHVQGS